MWYIIPFIGLSLLFLVIFSLKYNDKKRRFFTKLITSFLFVILGIVVVIEQGASFNNMYCRNMIVALCISFLGDFALGQYNIANPLLIKRSKSFYQLLGLLFFSVSQIIFIGNFMSMYEFQTAFLLIPFILVFVAILILSTLKVFDKKMTVLVLVYSLLLSFMVASTLNVYYMSHNTHGLIVLIAGILFSISDFTLIFKYYFHKFRYGITIISTGTYYIAQTLFALSIYFYLTI